MAPGGMQAVVRRVVIVGCTLAITVTGFGGRAEAAGFRAGAAALDITPPNTGNRVGGLLCPAAVWTGPRIWDFDEPYIDRNHDGEFTFGEPFCDANHNLRYDGIWVSGGVNHHARSVLTHIWVRTFVVSDGTHGVAVASVDSLGMFAPDIDQARIKARAVNPWLDLIVSSDHNESSPDPIGLYGPSVQGENADFGTTSGVDDYYMSFLEQRIADSVTQSVRSMRPATLRVIQTTAPTIVPTLNHWPTTNRKDDANATPPPANGRIDAWDPTVRILQAIDASSGATIFTSVGYDSHVQNLGHSSDPSIAHAITADWVGPFTHDVEAAQGGVAIYLQGANGSIETPQVPSRHNAAEGTIDRSNDIGHELAAVANAAIPAATPLAPGPVGDVRERFKAPLENQLFIAAFALHLFPHRQLGLPALDPSWPLGRPSVTTSVTVAHIGALDLIANPGEAFPALTKGSHWGTDEGCTTRANPPVPSQHSTAGYRWDVGLADDMVGYLIPAWGWDADRTVYLNPLDSCASNDTAEGGHHHALEDESLGPDAGNYIATHLASVLDRFDTGAHNPIASGRYLFADGTVSRRPYIAPFARDGVVDPTVHAIGVVGDSGAVVMLPGFDTAGSKHATAHGTFVDFDGHPQTAADQATRGMTLLEAVPGVAAGTTFFLDVFGPSGIRPVATPVPLPVAAASREFV